MTIIGIDPGKSGALVALQPEGVRYWFTDRAFTAKIGRGSKTDYKPGSMAQALRSLKGEATAFIERQGAQPKQGGVSNFTTGRGFGLWEGILSALEIPYHIVISQEWESVILKGIPGEGKARSIFAAGRLFPELDLVPEGCRVASDGLADALCLASYGRLFLAGKTLK